MAKANILLLNGCTSAGKSSLTRALQAQLPDCWLRFGIDDAFGMLPVALHNDRNGFWFDTDAWGDPRLNLGPAGKTALAAYRRAVVAMANSGASLIVDEVILDRDARDDWLVALPADGVIMCGVRCELDELCRRERARGDRLIGQARGQFRHVHDAMIYDIEVDTTSASPEDCARQISAFLTESTASNALAMMRKAALA
jgi:chloramphenicol 3-O phosphotransferase